MRELINTRIEFKQLVNQRSNYVLVWLPAISLPLRQSICPTYADLNCWLNCDFHVLIRLIERHSGSIVTLLRYLKVYGRRLKS